MKSTFTTSRFRILIRPRKDRYRYAVAVGIVLFMVLIRWILSRHSDPAFPPYVIFYPAVLFAAWYGGIGPALVAAGLSIFSEAAYLVFLSQKFDSHAAIQLLVFILVNAIICLVTENLRRSASIHNEYALELLDLQKRELAEANKELRNEIQERMKLEREVLEVIQQEQKRFSTELHDGLCQKLTGIMMLASVSAQRLEKKSLVEWGEIKKIADLIDQSITDARDMARGLFPVELEANSLMFSLRGLANRIENLYQLVCDFHCPEPILVEDNILATHLYRIAQEAIQNAVSHGEAKNIDMTLMQRNHEIVLTIQNDGKLFEPDFDGAPGIGLQIMRYRARILNATLDFQNLANGTLFTCSLPFPDKNFALQV